MRTYNHWHRSLHFFVILITLVFLLPASSLMPYHVQAYKSFVIDSNNPKLPGSATILYYFPDHLTSMLGISSTGANTVNALNQWNDTSWYSVFDIGIGGTTVTQTQNRVLALDFWGSVYLTPCGFLNTLPSSYIGYACGANFSAYINSNAKWKWTNTGSLHGTPAPGSATYIHYLSTVLHEIGHLFGATHTAPSPPVMYATVSNKPTLTEDDKRGPAQFYGPYTGWETPETMGNTSWVAYQSNVSSPALVSVSTESGVTPYSGSRYIRLAGTANNNYSYAYMKLLSADNDELGSNARHLTIVNGTTLSWRQYNHTQKRMAVDIAFTDGTVLRDTGLTDQNGICVHPACRASYNTGVWYYFTVNLSSLAGKRVKDIMIAYDNGNNGPTGAYKAYFDDLRITY